MKKTGTTDNMISKKMPTDRKILLILLLVSILAAAGALGWDSIQGLFLGSARTIQALEDSRDSYLKLLAESEAELLPEKTLAAMEKRIRNMSESYFSKEELESSGNFGRLIESMARESGLDIIQISDVANGFQFVTRGSVSRNLQFLQRIDEYPYAISTPTIIISGLPDGSYRQTVQCFPVILNGDTTEEKK